MKIRVIKNEQDYQDALKMIEKLMDNDPNPESDEGEQISLLSTLLQDYESHHFPTSLPSAIDAINFRMEQLGIKPKDLVPYIGSAGRVSEILSGKRQLTLEMVRALEEGLGIPAKVLIKSSNNEHVLNYENWSDKLIKEMKKRGYFEKMPTISNKGELLKAFFSPFDSFGQAVGMLRKSNYRSSPRTDKQALAAWTACVLKNAKKIKTSTKYAHGSINQDVMKEIAQLSVKENGPIAAINYLKKLGIALVIEPHFEKTYLDGATLLLEKEKPVIGLTLRHDRLDNFWFTLMHEIAHLVLHFNLDISLFYDEIEGITPVDLDHKESEADKLAQESLLPSEKWEVSPARIVPSSMAAKSLANELGVHEAVIAGQIRHKGNKYIYLSKMVNEAKVRNYFSEIKW